MKRPPKRILIIDDDPNVIAQLEKWLKDSGREVTSALNAEVGFAKAKEEFPDLILSDLMLPGIGGVDLARQLKADSQTKDIPIIFITVTLGVEKDKGDETLDIDGCLYRVFAKPLHNRKLLSEIRKSINRRIHGNVFRIKGS